ncbi:hypothetical protein GUITHDRAFT_104069 [Guillardia theta CCMP2712]|uniref:Inositol phosphatase domain-containing protein n=1 Tax=Guillardia theta (strain CCMP2712) TaxID=905079 RepID=L1JPZ5_GUITC|nr:hypothetical protein GUITHDRAFT_104069 [Guillardia theta CCMP2712]EKX50255.1 hypothetical protein GUITHDRAFT_104069 [Guillardia theta CCMP2712]|eukprot:XP_005837235.1 hypothetical protein GUITHDRAFT_104069 [Guillardia theta CCMP2712]
MSRQQMLWCSGMTICSSIACSGMTICSSIACSGMTICSSVACSGMTICSSVACSGMTICSSVACSGMTICSSVACSGMTICSSVACSGMTICSSVAGLYGMAEEFSSLEAELLDAARAGNEEYIVALLKDVGKVNNPRLSQNVGDSLKPNGIQRAAIDKAAQEVLGRKREEGEVDDMRETSVGSTKTGERERLLKGYMVSSVNEWGADQTRILLLTNQAIHRVKFDFHRDKVVKWHTDRFDEILRVEYGNFQAASSSLTTMFLRHEIEDQQGFRIFTVKRDGKPSINDIVAEERAGKAQDSLTPMEYFREYRALLAESEPWKEEVFMLEFIAALQAVKVLRKAKFEVRLAKVGQSR